MILHLVSFEAQFITVAVEWEECAFEEINSFKRLK